MMSYWILGLFAIICSLYQSHGANLNPVGNDHDVEPLTRALKDGRVTAAPPPTYIYTCHGPLVNVSDHDCQTTENKTVISVCYDNSYDLYLSCPQLCAGARFGSLRVEECHSISKCSAFLRHNCELLPVPTVSTGTTKRPTKDIPLPSREPDNYNSDGAASAHPPGAGVKQNGGSSVGMEVTVAVTVGALVIVGGGIFVYWKMRARRNRRSESPVHYNGVRDEVRIDVPMQDPAPAAPGPVPEVPEPVPEVPEPVPVTDEYAPMLQPAQASDNPNDFNGHGNTQPSVHKSRIV